MSDLVILLPPSEGKAEGGSGRWSPGSGRFGRSLSQRRHEIVERLAAIGGGDERLLGVGGKHLERAVRANASLGRSRALPAAERYTGVVYDGLEVGTLPDVARSVADESIVIVSGLLGLVAFTDPVPDYRLKMGASLAPFGVMSTWWRDELSAVLNRYARAKTVIDLLPHEHRAAWSPSPRLHVVRVGFVERSGKVAGHDAKAAKGRLVRHLVCGGSLGTFRHERFELDLAGVT